MHYTYNCMKGCMRPRLTKQGSTGVYKLLTAFTHLYHIGITKYTFAIIFIQRNLEIHISHVWVTRLTSWLMFLVTPSQTLRGKAAPMAVFYVSCYNEAVFVTIFLLEFYTFNVSGHHVLYMVTDMRRNINDTPYHTKPYTPEAPVTNMVQL